MGRKREEQEQPQCLARDWSVRGLPAPSAAQRAAAAALDAEFYDGRRAARDSGLPIQERGLERAARPSFLPLPRLFRMR